MQESAAQSSKLDNLASIDILIGDKNYWSKGYGYDAMKTVMDYGFKKLKLRKIELKVFSYNKRAIKLYKKIGFLIEGRRLKSIFYNGNYYDEIEMGIFRV